MPSVQILRYYAAYASLGIRLKKITTTKTRRRLIILTTDDKSLLHHLRVLVQHFQIKKQAKKMNWCNPEELVNAQVS